MTTFPSSTLTSAAETICARLTEAGHTAWFAGGCVRDALLGEAPKDIDIATDARPEQVQSLFPRSRAVGAHFGVVLVREGEFDFDVATFREDGEYRDGRRPEQVRYAGAEEDARRRDFTLNALFWDSEAGEVRDYVGGREDLGVGLLRAVGDPVRRFAEDSLRLLRAVRFAARFDFTIEADTWDALRNHAGDIARIAPERIYTELQQMWTHPSRLRAFELLDESGLLARLFPELEAMKGVEQPPRWHPEGDVFEHTRLVLSHLPADAPAELAWAAILHDIGKPPTASWDGDQQRWRFNGHARVGAEIARELLGRLRAPNRTIEEVGSMVSHHMDFMHVQAMRRSTLRRMMARSTFGWELDLHLADCLGSNGFRDNYEFMRSKAEEFAAETVVPPPLLDGHAVMEATGMCAGPALGKLLRELHDHQLEGEVNTRQQAIDWVRGRVGNQRSPASESS